MKVSTYGMGYFQVKVLHNFDEAEKFTGREFGYALLCSGLYGAAFFMCLETGTVCFLLSVLCRKRPLGAAVGIAVLLYLMDLMCGVLPALEKIKYITPFYYSSAADIFAGGTSREMLWSWAVGAAVLGAALGGAFWVYGRKDLM